MNRGGRKKNCRDVFLISWPLRFLLNISSREQKKLVQGQADC